MLTRSSERISNPNQYAGINYIVIIFPGIYWHKFVNVENIYNIDAGLFSVDSFKYCMFLLNLVE